MLDSDAELVVKKVDAESVKTVLVNNEWISFIGHESTAKVMSAVLGMEIPTNRTSVKLSEGDTVVVFQILQRLPEGKVLSDEELKSVKHGWFIVVVQAKKG